MKTQALRNLTAAVQGNCDIADARHAGDLSMCIFLLQMREYYRWRKGLGFDAVLNRTELGGWLAESEQHWQALEGCDFAPLSVEGERFDAFAVDPINERLHAHGLCYGAGVIGPRRASFFLAERHDGGSAPAGLGDLSVLHCGRELARGLLAPPAMLQGGDHVVLRRESLARWLWERYEAFSLKRADGPFAEVARAHELSDTAAFIDALPRLVDEAAPMLLLHELGEHQAAQWLEPGWAALRLSVEDLRPALQLRAVRDQIADLSVSLPALLEHGTPSSIHLWFASYDGLRDALFPSLVRAYQAWRGGDDGEALRAACAGGLAHFSSLARELLVLRDPARVARRLGEPTVVFGPT